MKDTSTESIRESYDRLADEYARRIFNELQHKALDRELLNRFAAQVRGHGEVCDMGCGPGQVARYLHDLGVKVFGLDLSPHMLEQARQLSPEISFLEGNMMALDVWDGRLAGIAAFYAIVNIPQESLPFVFRANNPFGIPPTRGLSLTCPHFRHSILAHDRPNLLALPHY